jgi:hypothetical protein
MDISFNQTEKNKFLFGAIVSAKMFWILHFLKMGADPKSTVAYQGENLTLNDLLLRVRFDDEIDKIICVCTMVNYSS